MSNNALPGTLSAHRARLRPGDRTGSAAPSTSARRGLAGLVVLAVAFTGAAGALGVRTWKVGSDLGAALFPVEDIVELATVAAGTVMAGWVGLHAFLALACVVAGRWGPRWAAGERAVALHGPAFVRRLRGRRGPRPHGAHCHGVRPGTWNGPVRGRRRCRRRRPRLAADRAPGGGPHRYPCGGPIDVIDPAAET
jgi:hypothetical protein